MVILIFLERTVASFLSKSGIVPIDGNSSITRLTGISALLSLTCFFNESTYCTSLMKNILKNKLAIKSKVDVWSDIIRK